jgi:hypothetical protein
VLTPSANLRSSGVCMGRLDKGTPGKAAQTSEVQSAPECSPIGENGSSSGWRRRRDEELAKARFRSSAASVRWKVEGE